MVVVVVVVVVVSGVLKKDGYEAGSGYEVLAEVATTTLYLGSLSAPHVNVTGFGQT